MVPNLFYAESLLIAKAGYRTELDKELLLLTAVLAVLDGFFPHALLMLGGFHHMGLSIYGRS